MAANKQLGSLQGLPQTVVCVCVYHADESGDSQDIQ